MSETNVEQLVEQLGNISTIQLIQLTKSLEEKWGVKAAPVVQAVVQPGPNTNTPKVEEKTEFEVVLISAAGDKKIAVIKAVREVTGLGLKEAKDLVEGAPKTVKESAGKAEAEEIKKKLEDAGGTIELR